MGAGFLHGAEIYASHQSYHASCPVQGLSRGMYSLIAMLSLSMQLLGFEGFWSYNLSSLAPSITLLKASSCARWAYMAEDASRMPAAAWLAEF